MQVEKVTEESDALECPWPGALADKSARTRSGVAPLPRGSPPCPPLRAEQDLECNSARFGVDNKATRSSHTLPHRYNLAVVHCKLYSLANFSDVPLDATAHPRGDPWRRPPAPPTPPTALAHPLTSKILATSAPSWDQLPFTAKLRWPAPPAPHSPPPPPPSVQAPLRDPGYQARHASQPPLRWVPRSLDLSAPSGSQGWAS